MTEARTEPEALTDKERHILSGFQPTSEARTATRKLLRLYDAALAREKSAEQKCERLIDEYFGGRTFDYEASERRALAAESRLADATALLRGQLEKTGMPDADGEGPSNATLETWAVFVQFVADLVYDADSCLNRSTPTAAPAPAAESEPEEDTESLIEQLDEALCSLLHTGGELGEHSPRTHLDLFYERNQTAAESEPGPQIVQYDGHAWVRLGVYERGQARIAGLERSYAVRTESCQRANERIAELERELSAADKHNCKLEADIDQAERELAAAREELRLQVKAIDEAVVELDHKFINRDAMDEQRRDAISHLRAAQKAAT